MLWSEAGKMQQGLQRGQAEQECCAKKTCLFQSFGHEHYPQKKTKASEENLNQKCAVKVLKTQNYFLPVNNNQVSITFCDIRPSRRAFRLPVTQKIVTFRGLDCVLLRGFVVHWISNRSVVRVA